MSELIEHYDKLIDEGDDPTKDSPELREYMDKWDGRKFIDAMCLSKEKTVLEIGVGTGRLATRVAPFCKEFTGIDLSPKTIVRARENLAEYPNAKLVCDDFNTYSFKEGFDVIYSSLTFMHIENKAAAIKKAASLLCKDGLFVLSIDKNRDEFIDMGTRKIKIYPDKKEDIPRFMCEADLNVLEEFETEHAYLFVGKKPYS